MSHWMLTDVVARLQSSTDELTYSRNLTTTRRSYETTNLYKHLFVFQCIFDGAFLLIVLLFAPLFNVLFIFHVFTYSFFFSFFPVMLYYSYTLMFSLVLQEVIFNYKADLVGTENRSIIN